MSSIFWNDPSPIHRQTYISTHLTNESATPGKTGGLHTINDRLYILQMKKYWQLLQPDNNLVENIRGKLQCNLVTATILVNRKIISKDDALRFLKPSLNNMRPPCSMKDMDAAVRRIYSAITGHEKILIFGDYDVDGITATTILFEFLHYTKADVSYYIPHRTKEGYGLHTKHIID